MYVKNDKVILGKRDIHSMELPEIMNHLWADVGPQEGVSLTDRFTVDALVQMCEHPEWDSFPPYLKDWIVDVVDDILKEKEND